MDSESEINSPFRYEPIGKDIFVCVSAQHRFGTDAFLLTAFSRYRKKDVVCEFGTGCGIIPLLMQRNAPPARIYALDIQEQAIAQLQAGMQKSHAEHIFPVCTDLNDFQGWTSVPYGQVSLVICNPPYQPCGTGYLSDAPAQQIARHGVCCTPEAVCHSAAVLLNTGGRLCVCGKPERLPDYICAMRANQLEPKRLQFVSRYAGDMPWLFLLEGRKQAKPFLQMEKPFIMYERNADGEQGNRLTAQAEQLYFFRKE